MAQSNCGRGGRIAPPGIAVETVIAHRPPHRPVRAQLRHTVPTLSRRQLGLPYAVERLCHAKPAQCPVRALLARVPLGPRPWLHRLRSGHAARFVRRLRSYYGGVRLLTIVHHRLRLLTFPTRTRAVRYSLGLLVDREISRVPHKKRTHMPGSPTTPGRRGTRVTRPSVLPSTKRTASAPRMRSLYRGRDGDYSPPPARIRTGPTKTYGSYLEWVTRNRWSGHG